MVSKGFAAALRTEAYADMDAEQQRHAREVARVQERLDILAEAGSRTRRQLFLDLATSDRLVIFACSNGPRMTASEVAALLTRPQTKALRAVLDDVLAEAQQDVDGSAQERFEVRLAKIVDAVLDVDVWCTCDRVRLLLDRYHTATLNRMLERARADPGVAVMLGMHSGKRTWGSRSTSQLGWLVRRLGDNPWFTIGAGVEVGRMRVDVTREVRARLCALEPVDLAARLAEQLPTRTEKGPAALLSHAQALEVLVAGVVEPAAV